MRENMVFEKLSKLLTAGKIRCFQKMVARFHRLDYYASLKYAHPPVSKKMQDA
ncbi:hypothetical protein D3C78_1845550 [compost metagenome]